MAEGEYLINEYYFLDKITTMGNLFKKIIAKICYLVGEYRIASILEFTN
jgi:hypothetical protein